MRDDTLSLRVAATLAFEELGLMCVGAPCTERLPTAAFAAAVRVHFTGARDGQLTLLVTDDVFHALAENMLGVEGARADTWRWDALGEMANVICGNVLPHVLGVQARLVLAPPVHVPADTGAICTPNAAQIEMEVESGRARIVLEVRDAVHERARPGAEFAGAP